ncbi:MAG: hypothetical protein K8U57_19815 [Planctomycetes bacterium]|nr:hypothetical protein [Planctomycetota bacterium]
MFYPAAPAVTVESPPKLCEPSAALEPVPPESDLPAGGHFSLLKTKTKKKRKKDAAYKEKCPPPVLEEWDGSLLADWYRKAAPNCPGKYAVALGHKENIQDGLGVILKCDRWRCAVCHFFLRWRWATTFRQRLREAPPHGTFFEWRGPLAKVGRTLRKRINELGGEYACVAVGNADAVVISTVPVIDSTPVAAKDADRALIDAIAAVMTPGSEVSENCRPVTSSTGWKLKKTGGQGRHEKLSGYKSPDRSQDVMGRFGIEIGGIDKATGLVRYGFPKEFTRAERRWACLWASAETFPEGWVEGDEVPDFDAVFEALVMMDAPEATRVAATPTAYERYVMGLDDAE